MADPQIIAQTLDKYSEYYLNGVLSDESDRRVVTLFATWFRDDAGGRPLLQFVKDLGTITQIFFDLNTFSAECSGVVDDFSSCLRDQPTKVLAHLGLALVSYRDSFLRHHHTTTRIHPITVRFTSVHPPLPLVNLKSGIVGKLVSISGYVVRVSSIHPLVTQASFECPKCGEMSRVFFEDGKYNPPTRCENSSCRSRTFEFRRDTAVTVDFQRVKVQEVDNSLADAGRVPRTVEVELTEGLVDSCIPGDVVTVVGIVNSVNADHAAGKAGKRAASNSLFLLYISANSVTNNRSNSSGADAGATNDEQSKGQFTSEDLYAIRAIATDTDLFAHVVGSICPSIYGHEHVKAGLALGIFGGSKPQEFSRDRLSVRSDPHVLIVGDPGLGKSQMLRAAAQVAPRSVFVSANTTTASGLTVTVSKESGGGGDVVLEAGALVLSDQGVCCVDEFDKIGCDSHCLLEAMEQQQVSVAKSGIVASLSARCSVLAAANPCGGHYDSSKTVNENLKMSSALLSRFDLVFILLDKPEEAHDRMLSEYIMRSHLIASQRDRPVAAESNSDLDSHRVVQAIRSASARNQHRPPIPPDLLRKYIMYARKYVHPKLTGEAATVLQKLYLKFRDQARGGDSLPITTRQLESLVRLSQARARIELREAVTQADALDVVALMEQSQLETFRSDSGFDFGRKGGMSLSKQVKSFVAELNRIASSKNSALFQTADMLEIAGRMNLGVSDFHGFLDILNDQCYILKKGTRLWQLQTHVSSSQSSQAAPPAPRYSQSSSSSSSQGQYRRSS